MSTQTESYHICSLGMLADLKQEVRNVDELLSVQLFPLLLQQFNDLAILYVLLHLFIIAALLLGTHVLNHWRRLLQGVLKISLVVVHVEVENHLSSS